MHRAVKKAMEDASVSSEHTIAINLDIRNFSRFCRETESLDAALFVKKAFIKTLDHLFTESQFYKLHGDGLLILYAYTERSLPELLNSVTSKAIKAQSEFRDLFRDDPMVNFETPPDVGIGMSRGPVSRLYTKGRTLDYFGSPINLAARLSDMAEPKGIVIDSRSEASLLQKSLRQKFSTQKVYVKGFAESEPIEVLVLKELTRISDHFLRPIREPQWKKIEKKLKISELRTSNTFLYQIDEKPSDPSNLSIVVIYPSYRNGKRVPNKVSFWNSPKYEFQQYGDETYVMLYHRAAAEYLEKLGLRANSEVTIQIKYKA